MQNLNERPGKIVRRSNFKVWAVSLPAVMLLSLGIGVREGGTQLPPVAAPLVREGAFAMNLAEALNVRHPTSEVEAESMLGAVGISPRNGWIADYPVTPDIIGELQDSIAYAAEARTISMDQDSALRTLADVQAAVQMSVSPGASGPPYAEGTAEEAPSGEGAYPDQTAINNYYYEAGPPVLTYYAPPPAYYYLYAWVPYPFWRGRTWFGGYFVLNDFHRHFIEGGRVFVVSNHFTDIKAHRVFRIDPVNRLRGRTYAGIGAPRSNAFINAGTQRAQERVFHGGPSRSFVPSRRATGAARLSSAKSYGDVNPFSADRVYGNPPGTGRAANRRVEKAGSTWGESRR